MQLIIFGKIWVVLRKTFYISGPELIVGKCRRATAAAAWAQMAAMMGLGWAGCCRYSCCAVVGGEEASC